MGKAYDGYGFILVEFQFGKDLAEATQDMRDAISAKRADLPLEMEEPIIRKFNDTDRPIVSLALSSARTLSQAELTRLADPTITRELRVDPRRGRGAGERQGRARAHGRARSRRACSRRG